MEKPLETIDILTGLDAAIRLIAKYRTIELSQGATAIWRKLNHAEDYLDKQVAALLAADPA